MPLIFVVWGARNPLLGYRSHTTEELARWSAVEGVLSTAQTALMAAAALLLMRTIRQVNRRQEARANHDQAPVPQTPVDARHGHLLASSSTLPVLVTIIGLMFPQWMFAAPAIPLWIGYLALTRGTAKGYRVMLVILAVVTAWFALLVPLTGAFAPVSLLLFLFIMVPALVTATLVLQDLDRLPRARRPT